MNLKKKIKESGMTLEQLAIALQVSQPALSKMISNGNPTYQKLKDIADVLGISVAELVDDGESISHSFVCPNCKRTFKLIEEE